jgi:tryptophan synthase beta subunit
VLTAVYRHLLLLMLDTHIVHTQTLAKTEGLISALEPSHAIYHAMQVRCAVIAYSSVHV